MANKIKQYGVSYYPLKTNYKGNVNKMAIIQWGIEITDISDNNPTINHSDNIPGADISDDRFGKLQGTECNYNKVVHLLCARVNKSQYRNETYAVSFYDGTQLILQSNIGYKTIPSIHKIIK